MTASERELRNRADHYGWRMQRRDTDGYCTMVVRRMAALATSSLRLLKSRPSSMPMQRK